MDKCAARWHTKYDVTIDVEEYRINFQSLYRFTSVVKYCDFQYLLLLGKIPANTNSDELEFKRKQPMQVMPRKPLPYVFLYDWSPLFLFNRYLKINQFKTKPIENF